MNITFQDDFENVHIVWDMVLSMITGLFISLVCVNLVGRINFFEKGFDVWAILYGFLCLLLVGAHASMIVGFIGGVGSRGNCVISGVGMGFISGGIISGAIVLSSSMCNCSDPDSNVSKWLRPVLAICGILGGIMMAILVVMICLERNDIVSAAVWTPISVFVWLWLGVRVLFECGYHCLGGWGNQSADDESVTRNFKRCGKTFLMIGWMIGGTVVGILCGEMRGGLQLRSVSGVLNGVVVGLLTLANGKINTFFHCGMGLLLGSVVGGLIVLLKMNGNGNGKN